MRGGGCDGPASERGTPIHSRHGDATRYVSRRDWKPDVSIITEKELVAAHEPVFAVPFYARSIHIGRRYREGIDQVVSNIGLGARGTEHRVFAVVADCANVLVQHLEPRRASIKGGAASRNQRVLRESDAVLLSGCGNNGGTRGEGELGTGLPIDAVITVEDSATGTSRSRDNELAH